MLPFRTVKTVTFPALLLVRPGTTAPRGWVPGRTSVSCSVPDVGDYAADAVSASPNRNHRVTRPSEFLKIGAAYGQDDWIFLVTSAVDAPLIQSTMPVQNVPAPTDGGMRSDASKRNTACGSARILLDNLLIGLS